MKKFVLVLLQFIFVNSVLLLTFLYYDSLPRFVTAIFFYFVFPVLFWIPVKHILSKVDSFFFEDEDIMPGIVTAITIWIASIIGTVTSVQDYFLLWQRGEIKVKNIEDVPLSSRAAYIEIENVILQVDLVGVNDYSGRTKSGDYYTNTTYHYRSLPVATYPPGPRTFFIGFHRTNDREGIEEEIRRYTKDIKRTIKGLIVRDPYTIAQYDHAILESQERNKFETADNYFIIEPRKSFDLILKKYEGYAIWFFSIVNILWFVLPSVWIVRM